VTVFIQARQGTKLGSVRSGIKLRPLHLFDSGPFVTLLERNVCGGEKLANVDYQEHQK
jgi:hypothetical protein